MYNIAVILAGGIGSRVGGKTPKQLLPLADGRSILEHSIDAFEASPCIEEIAVVMHPEWVEEAQHICARNTWRKVKQIIPGGTERWESSYHAIRAYQQSANIGGYTILLHDAARPFVSQRIIAEVCEAFETHEAVTVAVPVPDTLYKVLRDNVQGTKGVEAVVNRAEYMRAQTPQAFHLETIAEAFEDGIHKGYIGVVTDDIAVLKAYRPDTPVYIVQGDEQNRKITYKEDLAE